MIQLETPNFSNGFALRDGAPANPIAWKDLSGYWDPNIGKTGVTLLDNSVHNNHATLTNMAPLADWLDSEHGRVLHLTRNVREDDALVVGDKTVFDDMVEFTFIFHVKFDTIAADGILACKGTFDNTSPFLLWMDFTALAKTFAFILNDAGGGTGTQKSAFTISTNVWYDIAYTFKADVETRIYINGAEDANSPFDTSAITTIKNAGAGNSIVRFGNTSGVDTKGFDGKMGRIAFYRRVLTHNEIKQHYKDKSAVTRLLAI